MTAAEDDAFWLHEADPQVDICDPRLTVDSCLEVIVPELEAHVDLTQARIVEIGCGIGRLTNAVCEVFPAASVVGVDINQRFLDLARQDADRRIVSPTYVHAHNDAVPSHPPADAVYSMAVFQHLANDRKRAYIAQVGRVLRPRGVLCFQYVEGVHASRCMYDALIGDIRAWCEAAGLAVQRVQHDLLMPRWTWVTATREVQA